MTFEGRLVRNLECSLLKLLPKCNCHHCLVTFCRICCWGVRERPQSSPWKQNRQCPPSNPPHKVHRWLTGSYSMVLLFYCDFFKTSWTKQNIHRNNRLWEIGKSWVSNSVSWTSLWVEIKRIISTVNVYKLVKIWSE